MSGAHKKKIHLAEEAVEEGEGSWIVSYADMMTLLCVFFILMFVFSKPDPKKVEELKKDTITYFGGVYKTPYQEITDDLKRVVDKEGLGDQIKITADESGVAITFIGAVFFKSASADIEAVGQDVVEKLFKSLGDQISDFNIQVEGHTDDSPINSLIYPSNWELSGARASSVVRLLLKLGVKANSLSANAFAETVPVVPNRDDSGTVLSANQSQNRRVVIKVLKTNKDSDNIKK